MEEIAFGVSIFLGLWLSWTVGYHLNDWLTKIFAYRVKVTDTHVEFTAATPAEIVEEYEEKVQELETHGTLPICDICHMADLGRNHYHPRKPNPILDELNAGWEADLLEDVQSLQDSDLLEDFLLSMTDDQKDALYFLLGAAVERMEEQEEIGTFDGNLRYVSRRPTSKRPPYYDHLDL